MQQRKPSHKGLLPSSLSRDAIVLFSIQPFMLAWNDKSPFISRTLHQTADMTHQSALRPGFWLVDWSLNASQPEPKDLSNYVISNFDFGWNMFQHQKGNNFKAAHVSLIKTHLIGISAKNQDCLYIHPPSLDLISLSIRFPFTQLVFNALHHTCRLISRSVDAIWSSTPRSRGKALWKCAAATLF